MSGGEVVVSFVGGQDAVADVGYGVEHKKVDFKRSRMTVFLLSFTSKE